MGMCFCFLLLEFLLLLSLLFDEGVGIFFFDVIEKYMRIDCKILRIWIRLCWIYNDIEYIGDKDKL